MDARPAVHVSARRGDWLLGDVDADSALEEVGLGLGSWFGGLGALLGLVVLLVRPVDEVVRVLHNSIIRGFGVLGFWGYAVIKRDVVLV